LRVLGEGTFGKVFLESCDSDGSLDALKQMDFKDMNLDENALIVREIMLLEFMHLHHPNIVMLREEYDSEGGMKNIVMEVADGDNLFEEIKNR
jgi:serine/threonine protein kinase